MSACLDEIGEIKPAQGFDKVNYPGERAKMRMDKAYATGGVDVADELVEYLKGEPVHFDRYDHKNRFAD